MTETKETTEVYGFDIDEIERSQQMGIVPEPPKPIRERLEKEDKVWRWMGPQQIRYLGFRGYVQVSLIGKERDWIREHGALYGLHLGTDNSLRWREDAFLAAMPRKLYEELKRRKRLRTQDQTALSKQPLYADVVERGGGKVLSHSVEEWQDREDSK